MSRASCDHEIPGDAPAGLCPRCALTLALEAPSLALPWHQVGDYELEELLARGGMGVVYRARHRSLGRTVALKMLSVGIWAEPDELARFRGEAELAASLEHENIVPIYEVGEHEGQPYYAMRLMQESLAAHVTGQGELSPARAAALVATVARAVHWGHLRGVVHRDLKPENILLDPAGRPYVGDFGVSLRLGARARDHLETATGAIVGTPGYLAPEQAGAFGGERTIAVDVWGLGAVLYRLLCGRPPFIGDSSVEIVRRLLEEEPARPRALRPGLDADLEIVCLRCLEKDPARRYASALDVALELERVLRGEPIVARRPGRWRRLARLARRYPVRAGLVVATAVFSLALALASTLAARAQEREMQGEVLRTNAWVARAVAAAVQLELRKLTETVAQAARDPELSAALATGQLERYRPPLQQPFDAFLLLDDLGVCRARWPHSPLLVGRDLSFRDYARLGASAAPGQALVAPPYRSEVDGSVRFSIAAPVVVDGRRAGVLVGSLTSDSTFGALSLQQEVDRTHQLRTVSLLGRHGLEREEATGARAAGREASWIVLVHPRLTVSGDAVTVGEHVLARLRRTGSDPAYADPLGGAPVLAGLAPVSESPFVVVVQTSPAQAIAANARWIRRVLGAGILALTIGLAVLALAFVVARRRPPLG